MKPRSVQVAKEARQLAWPWAMVMLPGLLFLASPWASTFLAVQIRGALWRRMDWELILVEAGAFLGTALLAALTLGAEFQYRTLALRLAQPVERHELWRQKFLVTIAAVAPPAMIYVLVFDMRFGRPFAVMAAVWIVVITASAIPATLLARSTLGALALMCFPQGAVQAGWALSEKYGPFPQAFWWAVAVVVVAYVAAMIWLGRRMLVRFQAVEGMQAGEAFVPGAHLVPEFVAAWFRCRPTQPLANLVRRELRLLRTLWMLSLLSVVAWIFVVAFRLMPLGPGRQSWRAEVVFGLTVIFSFLIAVLAGVLSLGEDKSWGTHSWHMTLPVSISVQWLVKLGTAAFTSVMCAFALPMSVLLVGGWLRGSPWLYVHHELLWTWPLEVALSTFTAFWCACAVKGAVRATLWLAPVVIGVLFAGEAGAWLADFIGSHGGLVEGAVAKLDPITLNRVFAYIWSSLTPAGLLALALVPLFALGLMQSRRLFRAEGDDTKLHVVRCATPLLALNLAGAFAGSLFMAFSIEAVRQEDAILRETHVAIEILHSANTRPAAAPQQLTVNDLARVAPLSDQTRRWLGDASIIAVPEPFAANTNTALGCGWWCYWQFLPGAPGRTAVPYSAVIRMAGGGHNCSMRFTPVGDARYGTLGAMCD
ncbi:MAG TPA: hypothetical protein VNK82_07345 [Terriglobales bacterium]|nr:hypothetical protein [Terriglobales bacterium]